MPYAPSQPRSATPRFFTREGDHSIEFAGKSIHCSLSLLALFIFSAGLYRKNDNMVVGSIVILGLVNVISQAVTRRYRESLRVSEGDLIVPATHFSPYTYLR